MGRQDEHQLQPHIYVSEMCMQIASTSLVKLGKAMLLSMEGIYT